MLYPISVEGKWGFIDSAGKVIISPQYVDVAKFSEGLAKVSVPGLTDEDRFFERNASGFIDEQGNFLIGPGTPPGYELPDGGSQYYSYDDFHDGMARFWVGDATGSGGYIDRSGSLVIPPKFPFAGDFAGGLACVSMPRKDGSPFGPKATGVIDRTGKFVIAPSLNFHGFRFSEGLCAMRFTDKSGDWQAAVVDTTGKKVVAAGKYHNISEFIGGMARVTRNGKVGFINAQGRVVIPLNFDQLWEFDLGNLTNGERDGSKFIVDRSGRCVREIHLGYDFDLSRLRYGAARVRAEGKVGYLNSAGELAIPLQFDHGEDFSGELALVKLGSTNGYISQRGELVWQTDCWDEPIRNSVRQPLSDFLPPGTLEALPLEYNWGRVKNAIVFASNARFSSLKPWFIKQFGSSFELSCDDEADYININFYADGVLGSFHAVNMRWEDADGFLDRYSSSNMILLRETHRPAVLGILIQD